MSAGRFRGAIRAKIAGELSLCRNMAVPIRNREKPALQASGSWAELLLPCRTDADGDMIRRARAHAKPLILKGAMEPTEELTWLSHSRHLSVTNGEHKSVTMPFTFNGKLLA